MEFMDERSRYEEGALAHDMTEALAVAAMQQLVELPDQPEHSAS